MEDGEVGPITLVFRPPPARDRVRTHLRGMAGVRGGLLIGVCLVPWATCAGLGANAPFPMWAFGLGMGLAAFSLAAGALGALVAPPPERILVLSPAGVRETTNGTTTERGWSWIVDSDESDTELRIRVKPDPVKSMRLANPAPAVLVVPKASTAPEVVAALRTLLAGR